VLEAIVFGAVASGGLLLGVAVGAVWDAPQRVVAAFLAFASGALLSAMAFELFEEAEHQAGLVVAAGALVAGAATFIVAAILLQRRFGGKEATGLALVAAVTLDGVPENLALGVTVVTGGSAVLLVAIVASNFAEALSSTVDIRRDGSTREALVVWAVAAVCLAAAVVLGRLALGGAGEHVVGACLAFAGGAVLASLADTLMPEAYREGGPLVGFATTAGFLLSYAVAA
jgi:ZIP family zinc transporter